MKLLLIARGYPTKRDPQWGIFEKDQALALQAAGHKVIIMCVELRYYWRSIGLSHFIENGLEIYSIRFPNVFTQITQKWALTTRQKLALFLYKKIEKKHGRPDVLYAHYLNNIATATIIKKEYEIPLVGIEHWSKLNQKKLPKFLHYQGCLAYNIADQVISVSNTLRNQILHHFNKESIVINNMVGSEFLNKLYERERKIDSTVKYVSVGSLYWGKGFDILIEAFRRSGLKEKGVVVTIIGKGKLTGNIQNALQSQINNAGLSDHIFLVGQKCRKEVIKTLQDSDVFILSSRAETFSVVCVEALSLGLPVIATTCGGPEDFINEGNGLLVPPNNSEALSVAMKKMYHTYNNYDRKKIAQECYDHFSPAAIAKKLTAVFEDVINTTLTQQNS